MAKALDLEKFRKMLLNERKRLESERHPKLEDRDERTELADYDNHPADAASDTFERTKDQAIDQNFRHMLERIDAALHKIDEGTYGKCDRCGEQIKSERLKAIPWATLCVECQETIERQ